MKKILLLFALVLTSFMYKAADAQVNIGVNIGSQPVWGPAGYDYAQYYYFPDIDLYYDVPGRQFIYFDGRSWVGSYQLPSFYDRFDLYNSYKVVINEPTPYLRNNFWHSRYYAYRGRPQENIYSSRDPRYFVIREHPMHDTWMSGRYNQYDGRDGYYNDRSGNFGRNDDRRFDNRRFDNNQRPDMQRNNDRRFDNNQRPDMQRNDRYDNSGRQNDNRGWNDRFFGGRRN